MTHGTMISIVRNQKQLVFQTPNITVKDGRKITQNVLGEHKVITTEQ